MAKVKMSLYEALSKLKVYEDRLSKFKFNDKPFLSYYTESNKTIGGTDIETVSKLMQGNFDSFNHLRNNVYNLRAAIYEANINNKISIPGFNDGKEITLAEAVSRFNSLQDDLAFINAVETQRKAILDKIESENKKYLAPEAIYAALAQLQNDAKKKDEAETVDRQIESYKTANTRKLLDPCKIVEKNFVENEKIRIQEIRECFNVKLMQADVSIELEVELED